MIWLIAGYLWMTLHQPYNVWTWIGTFRVERIYAAVMLIAWATASEKTFIENKVNMAVALMVIAMTVASILSPYQSIIDNVVYYNWMKVALIYLLMMTLIKSEKDLKILLGVMVISFFLYTAHSYWEFLCGRAHYAQGVVRMFGIDSATDANDLAAACNWMLPFLYPFALLLKKKWHYLFIPAYFLLTVRAIQLTGSRTGFVMLVFLVSLASLLSKHRLKIVPFLLLGAVVGWFSMGEQYKERYRTIWDSEAGAGHTQSYADGRLAGFYGGMEVFKTSPVYGVGPGQYLATPTATGGGTTIGHETHFLYGQIPAELGLLGIVGWLSMLACVGANHLQIRQLYKGFKQRGCEKEGQFVMRLSDAIVMSFFLLLLNGFGLHNGFRFHWIWYPAFQGVGLYVLQQKMGIIKQMESLPTVLRARAVA